MGDINRDVCMGFLPYLKTRSLVTLHPNILKPVKAGNSDKLFYVMDHFFVIN